MKKNVLKDYALQLLEPAGIAINGNQPWDLQINDQRFYARVLNQGSLGLGESYMDEWWDCHHLDQFFERLLKCSIEKRVKSNFWLLLRLMLLKFINRESKSRSIEVAKKHYDLGNHLFISMLDTRMNYTCGYWKQATTLDDAQRNKLELSCQKLMLKPGMRVLDIGCGFGSFLKYAAENYGIQGVGVTISKEQCEYAKENCAGFPIEIRLQDYRDVNEKFDRVVSLGMFEHVGHLNYRIYMQKVYDCLHDNSLFLLHTIGNNISMVAADPWISKYIFPVGMVPSIAQIGKAAEQLFVMEDWHNFGADYDKTLMGWYGNFNKNWQTLKTHYDNRFKRMWNYYLLSCAGLFRARSSQLWQIVFSKKGLPGGYLASR